MPRRIPKALPQGPGPKLSMFPHHKSPIEWFERLGDDTGVPFEGYVFRARIKKQEYAIKVFRFFDPGNQPVSYDDLLEDPSYENIALSDDPFYCECQAYGRINEYIKKKRSPSLSNIATPCHGFLFLKVKDAQALEMAHYIDLGLDEYNREYQKSIVGGLRPRAIVKDLATSDPWTDGKMLNTMLRGILRLNRHGIYNRDIRLSNYVGTELVDFGRAWTLPNLINDHMSKDEQKDETSWDTFKFQEMVESMFHRGYLLPEDVLAIRHPMKRRSDAEDDWILKLLEDDGTDWTYPESREDQNS
ncbi:unnamed protein product [Clonostachys rosea]|uniref:Protein kinase domain-containing protein n=1 Tax=Bionectria ochroleuca TaxID=29856 RepID=A0ABY6U6C9_BIOOC|nr:unnamed protein product [Clonostachys rosea]